MKHLNKIIGLLLSLSAVLGVFGAGMTGAYALTVSPIAANEGKITVWIFAVLIVLAAAAGIVYFIIHFKNKK